MAVADTYRCRSGNRFRFGLVTKTFICIKEGPLLTARAGPLTGNISGAKSRPGEPGFPAKKIGRFQAFEKAFTSGSPEMQVRQSGKTVKQTIFCPALQPPIELA